MNARNWFGILVALLLAAGQPAHAKKGDVKHLNKHIENCNRELRKQMQKAAAAANVELDVKTLTSIIANGATSVVGVISGLEVVPATDLPKGVDVAFGYLDLPQGPHGVQPPLPPDFYTFRVSASRAAVDASFKQNAGMPPDPRSTDGRPATPNATVELVDGDGKVAATLHAAINVWSLDVPVGGQQRVTTIEPVGGGQNRTLWFSCPNGWIVCVTFLWDDFFFWID